jgi:choline dehydrogenase-like flavoprotein
MSYRSLSYWFDSLGTEPEPRPALPGDLEVDVAIVGAGFTGLWTAYYLAIADPTLRVAVLERETAGFGASGRNGGWCMPVIHGLTTYVANDPERGGVLSRRPPTRSNACVQARESTRRCTATEASRSRRARPTFRACRHRSRRSGPRG